MSDRPPDPIAAAIPTALDGIHRPKFLAHLPAQTVPKPYLRISRACSGICENTFSSPPSSCSTIAMPPQVNLLTQSQPSQTQASAKRARRLGDAMQVVAEGQGAAAAKAEATPTGGRRLPRLGDAHRMDDGGEDAVAGEGGHGRHHQNIQLLNKAVLQAHQQIRELNGVSLQTYLVPHASAPVAAALQAGVSYDKAVKQDGPGHQWGIPHPHILLAFFEAANDMGLLLPDDVARHLQDLISAINATDTQNLAQLFSHFRCKSAYSAEGQPKLAKITFALHTFNNLTVGQLEGVQLAVAYYNVMTKILTAMGGTAS